MLCCMGVVRGLCCVVCCMCVVCCVCVVLCCVFFKLIFFPGGCDGPRQSGFSLFFLFLFFFFFVI